VGKQDAPDVNFAQQRIAHRSSGPFPFTGGAGQQEAPKTGENNIEEAEVEIIDDENKDK